MTPQQTQQAPVAKSKSSHTGTRSWGKVKLGEIFLFLRGAGLSKGQTSSKGKNKCILYGELYTTYGEVIKSTKSRTDLEQGVRSKLGDVLIPTSTTTSAIDLANATALLEEGVLIGGDITILRPKSSDVDPEFFAYYLTHQKKHEIARLGQGVTIIHLYGSHIRNILVDLPPLQEQKTIAGILQKWDEAIEKTEALISAKQKQFEWLIVELIGTQQDNPHWRQLRLGDIGTISSAGVDKKIVEGERPVRLVNYLDVYRLDKISSTDLNHQVTAPPGKAERCEVRIGDIFFTPSSEVRDDIARSAVAIENIPDAVYSYHVVRLRPTAEIDLFYSAYAFKSHSFYKQASTYADGSGQRYVVSQQSFREITVALPPLPEQKRIAQILTTAQSEIGLLKQLADRYRTQKRGLMQKLLTGEWRV